MTHAPHPRRTLNAIFTSLPNASPTALRVRQVLLLAWLNCCGIGRACETSMSWVARCWRACPCNARGASRGRYDDFDDEERGGRYEYGQRGGGYGGGGKVPLSRLGRDGRDRGALY